MGLSYNIHCRVEFDLTVQGTVLYCTHFSFCAFAGVATGKIEMGGAKVVIQ